MIAENLKFTDYLYNGEITKNKNFYPFSKIPQNKN